MKEISLLDLLKAGVHFGHTPSKRHPKMEPYIFTIRNNVHIIDLEKTYEKLKEALDFVKEVAKKEGLILFVGTKKQAQEIVKKYAQEANVPYVVNKWLGGTLTNFNEILKIINKLKDLKQKEKTGELEKYPKGEQAKFKKEIARLEEKVGGLENLIKIPDLVYLIDLKKEKTAVREINQLDIPCVAIVDTNADPSLVSHPIPGNDDAVRSIELITSLVTEAIKEGRKESPTKAEEEGKPEKESVKSNNISKEETKS